MRCSSIEFIVCQKHAILEEKEGETTRPREKKMKTCRLRKVENDVENACFG